MAQTQYLSLKTQNQKKGAYQLILTSGQTGDMINAPSSFRVYASSKRVQGSVGKKPVWHLIYDQPHPVPGQKPPRPIDVSIEFPRTNACPNDARSASYDSVHDVREGVSEHLGLIYVSRKPSLSTPTKRTRRKQIMFTIIHIQVRGVYYKYANRRLVCFRFEIVKYTFLVVLKKHKMANDKHLKTLRYALKINIA